MQQIDGVYLITPRNVDSYNHAANAGNGQAKQVLQAIRLWFDALQKTNHAICVCHAGAPLEFAFDTELPELFVVLMEPANGMVAGICSSCARKTELVRTVCKHLRLIAAEESSYGHTLH